MVEHELGRGGAALVYLARNPAGEPVALKILRPELTVSVAADRFLREIAIVRQLNHPNVGRLLDSGERDWLVYYVMPYIEGPSLKHHLARARRLSIDDTRRVARDLLAALAHAHEHGIVHRDVNPSNIILARTGAVLVDFGIARAVQLSGTERLTRSGIAVGTSSYMSPEQISADPNLDARADLYALGCVLFECLAGRAPYQHPNEAAILTMHLKEPVPDVRKFHPDIAPDLALAVDRALRKDRAERWGSAAAMAEALGGP